MANPHRQRGDAKQGNDVSVRRVRRCRDRAAPVPTAGRDGQCVSEIVAKPVEPPLDAMSISQRRWPPRVMLSRGNGRPPFLTRGNCGDENGSLCGPF
jgi:hypothetical protein